MCNAKEEFLQETEYKQVLCADISYNHDYCSNKYETVFHLPLSYTEDQYQVFLESLDFVYDSGYGGQELFGIIWYTDGTWSDRGEYDGSEWWEYNKLPAIPEYLKVSGG